MYCQRCYVRYVLRAVFTAILQQLLWSCLSTQLRCGSSHHRIRTARVFINKQNSSIIVAGNYTAFCGTRIPTRTPSPAPSRITILHLLAATSDGPPEWFPGQECQVDRDRRYDDVSSCRRAYEQKESGDDGCPGLQILEEATSRGVVWYFDSCNQNVQGHANSCPFTANTFRPELDSAKQTKLICVVCIFPVNRAISIGNEKQQ